MTAARRRLAPATPSRWPRASPAPCYGMLEKKITFSVPNAVQVLETRQGDCNEHTVLYVALARALGLPARTAVGLVYVNGAFFYHAWPEVWLGELGGGGPHLRPGARRRGPHPLRRWADWPSRWRSCD